jgi:hypothetical protein
MAKYTKRQMVKHIRNLFAKRPETLKAMNTQGNALGLYNQKRRANCSDAP